MASSTGYSHSSRKSGPSKALVAVLIAAGAVLLITVFAIVGGGTRQQFLFHVVKRGTLAITVTERGNLESQDEIKVKCQVDDFEGDQIHGTPILFIVPNGSSVTEGQLLVELDSATLRERLDRQILDTDRAHSFQILGPPRRNPCGGTMLECPFMAHGLNRSRGMGAW